MSDSSDSKQVCLDTEEDPILEIPKITGNEYVRKSQITNMDIRGMVVRCTSCLHQINHHDPDKVQRHFRLNVVMCNECYDFYGTSEFSQDEQGNYNYCTWCGNGGKLFMCDFCPNVFCSNCVRRNFGRAEVAKMSKEGWKCYCCEPQKLKKKVAYCNLILEYSKDMFKKKEKKTSESVLNKKFGPQNWAETEHWVLPAFEKMDDACKTFHRRLEKLKQIGSSQSKSLRHVIKKLDEIVNIHKTELNNTVKSLTHKYGTYIESRKKAEEKHDIEKTKPTEIHLNGVKDVKNATEQDEANFTIDLANSSKEESDVKSVKSESNANYQAKMSLLQGFSSDSNDDAEGIESIISILDSEILDEDKPKGTKVTNTCNQEEDNKHDNDMHSSNKNFKAGKIEKTETEEVKEIKFDDSSSATGKIKKGNTAKRTNKKFDLFTITDDKQVDSTSSLSSLSSDSDTKENDSKKQKSTKLRKKKTKVLDYNDPKLKIEIRIVLERCDHYIPNGETTIPLPASFILEDLDKEIKSLQKQPMKSRKAEVEKEKDTKEKKKNTAAPGKKQNAGESSSSICLSSDSEQEVEVLNKKSKKDKKEVEDEVTLAKKELLNMDSGSESSDSIELSGSDIEKKKKSTKRKAHSASSDEFQPRKKKKFDKLLNKRLFSDDESGNASARNNAERKKTGKKKQMASDGNKSHHSDSTTSSDSDEEKEKKKKKRKRIKKAASSSTDEGSGKEKDGEGKGSQSTPGKGRKNIKKILSKKELAEETKGAQLAERERRKRIQDRQKSYNVIADAPLDGKEKVFSKFVLEVDPVSKEEIVQIHPDIIEKLKPHQVEGVKFMWECTIESLQQLAKSPGSGCILAHCMGLGKTLQVITFLHTCLTNEHVNKKIKKAMVICPYNTVLNWAHEFEKWLNDVEGDVMVHQLTIAKENASRLDILKYWDKEGGVLILSYDIYRRLAMTKIPKLNTKQRAKVYECLIDPGPDIVVCDEGHILKNETSAISKACALFLTERRIVLTGTPLQNNLMEYHCMLSFVKPHLLGTAKEFRNRFVNPIMNGQYDDSNEYDVKRMKKRIHILHKLLEGCVQRCDYGALTKFLPPKHEFVISVKLSEVQVKMYRWYLDNLSQAKKELKIQGGTLFQDYNVLRNICTHPYIVHTSFERAEMKRLLKDDDEEDAAELEGFINDESEESKSSSDEDVEEVVKIYKTRSRREKDPDVESDNESDKSQERNKRWYDEFISDIDAHKLELSGKMVLLVDILKECEAIGDKVILFSQSLLALDIVEDLLVNVGSLPLSEADKQRDVTGQWMKNVDYFRMDGSTTADFRKQFIDMFNDPLNDRARLFLVSTRAGGLGTNLIGANRVFIFDASWNPSHDVQAIFRVYRFGQTKPVYIYRLLAQGTMEEKIYDRQVTKLSLSIRVVDEQQIDRHFGAAELAELYNFEPEVLRDRPTPMVPKDNLFADLLRKHKDWIVTYHEHDSLLQNQTEEDLTEEERRAAWNEYENEREGKAGDEYTIDDEIRDFCKEPDFDLVNYDESVIPSCKVMIENIITSLKKKFPNSPALDLRRKLLATLHLLRSLFQEKHVKILRMKQEYVAKGSVPTTVNKYLEELNQACKELAKHYDNVNALVVNDVRIAEQVRLANRVFMQQQQSVPNMQYQMPPGAAQMPPRLNRGYGTQFRGVPMSTNYSQFVRMMPPEKLQQFNNMVNKMQQRNVTITSEPTITEAPDVEEVTPPGQRGNQNQSSTVVFEEIE